MGSAAAQRDTSRPEIEKTQTQTKVGNSIQSVKIIIPPQSDMKGTVRFISEVQGKQISNECV